MANSLSITVKINKIKLVLAFAVCALLGFLCYISAPETDNRNVISFATATVSMFVCFAPALAFRFESAGNRTASGKIVGWLFFIILIFENFIFSFNEYKISSYIAITVLISLIGVGIIYSISKS